MSIIAILTNSLWVIIGFFIGGVLIDADHFPDYWIEYGFTLNFRKIYNQFLNPKFSHIIVPFHSIDLLLISLIFLPAGSFLWWIVIGMFSHIIADELTVSKRMFGYFFLYRLYHRFDSGVFFRNE